LKYTLLVFWVLFGLKFNAWADSSLFVVIPFVFYFKGNQRVKSIVIVSLTYFSLTLVLSIYSGIIDTWHIAQPIKSVLALLGTFGMLIYAYGNSTERLKRSIVTAVLIHAFIVILCYFFREFQVALNSITGFVSKSEFRVNGLTHSYGTTSLIHIIAIPLAFELYKGIKLTAVVFVVLLSAFMLARVGLYLGFIFLLLYNLKSINFRKILIGLSLIYGAYSFLIFLAETDPKSFSGDSQLYFLTMRWALESFVGLVDSGELTNNSVNTLNIAYLNDSLLEYIAGTGDFGRNRIHLNTDISYLLYFSYSGLIGIIFLVFVHSRLNILRLRNICMLLILLLTAFKEPTFFTRGLWSAYVLYLYLDYVNIKGSIATSSPS
jgi:hypothetical protein